MKNVAEYAACRENAADLSLLYERALEAGERELYIPAGEYVLHRPLRMISDMSITADGFKPLYWAELDSENCVNLGDVPMERA